MTEIIKVQGRLLETNDTSEVGTEIPEQEESLASKLQRLEAVKAQATATLAINNENPDTAGVGSETPASADVQPVSGTQRRGRPRKVKHLVETAPTVKRPRGRPRKAIKQA
jgi:hypothetical protein